MRRSEILGLRWLDVDILHGRILLPQSKNGEDSIIYLNRFAQSAIESLPFYENTKATDRLFRGVSGPRVQVAFTRVCKALHIADFRFHDLRHTAASWLRMRGADIHTWRCCSATKTCAWPRAINICHRIFSLMRQGNLMASLVNSAHIRTRRLTQRSGSKVGQLVTRASPRQKLCLQSCL